MPPVATREYYCRRTPAMGQTAPQKFDTAILVRGQIGPLLPLTGPAHVDRRHPRTPVK